MTFTDSDPKVENHILSSFAVSLRVSQVRVRDCESLLGVSVLFVSLEASMLPQLL